jgi:hypothetical protein
VTPRRRRLSCSPERDTSCLNIKTIHIQQQTTTNEPSPTKELLPAEPVRAAEDLEKVHLQQTLNALTAKLKLALVAE